MNLLPLFEEPNARLQAIASMSRTELLEFWSKDWANDPPKHVSRRLLELSAAWHLQCQKFGGPDRDLRRLLNGNAGSVAERQSIKPGTRLVREWNGRTHHVEVLAEGFRWNDKTLSVPQLHCQGHHRKPLVRPEVLRPMNKKHFRCAVYTRKSTEDGLEQDFNSLGCTA